ncbi:hypothetical protein MKX01_037096 [Papaver californicum]|nr:hypothetical protein MKX01_037096 [Papaver californicum]
MAHGFYDTSEGKNNWSDKTERSKIQKNGYFDFICFPLILKIRGRVAVGLNPNIKLYSDGQRTYYTLLIYLSGGSGQETKAELSSEKDSFVEPLVGGETVFYGPRKGVVVEVAPTEGMALFHLHGDNCMLHDARNVAKGVKYVFCSDVIFACWSSAFSPFFTFCFSAIGDSKLTSDVHWGCMHRSSQMLVAQALLFHHLGRSWRKPCEKVGCRVYC